jgi:thiamine biosynthesis lipoprotein
MQRRDFLHANLARATGELAQLGPPCRAAPLAAPELDLIRFSRPAMATLFEVVLPLGTARAYALANHALDLIDDLEAQLSVFRENSDVSLLNRQAALAPAAVEARLFRLLQQSASISAETEQAFDVSAGALVRAWGFLHGPRRVPSKQEREDALARSGMRHVVLHEQKSTVSFQRPGLELNLGSIGKGYALDRAAERLRAEGAASALLHGGHSSVLAIGGMPGVPRGWSVGIQHPAEPTRRLATLWIRDAAVGTSGSTYRYLEHAGQRLGHIIDPRTGWPARGIASATAVAPTAAEADALATAFFTLGVDKTREYVRTHPGIGALLLPDGPGRLPIALGIEAEL